MMTQHHVLTGDAQQRHCQGKLSSPYTKSGFASVMRAPCPRTPGEWQGMACPLREEGPKAHCFGVLCCAPAMWLWASVAFSARQLNSLLLLQSAMEKYS